MARRVDTDRVLARLGDQPKAITAQRVHMRVDHRDAGRRRHHGLRRRTAFAQHRQAGLGGQMMRRGDHAVEGVRGVQHRRLPPRLKASTTRTFQ